MAALTWDGIGEKKYDLGVSKGVLYKEVTEGTNKVWRGYAWNGLSNVTESPEGGESNDLYADNILYASLRGTEKLSGTIEAFTYPPEFEPCIGGYELATGVNIHQQPRENFCFCYRTEIGESNDPLVGYKIHIIYDCTANASERSYDTINDNPDAEPLSFDFDSVPVTVTGHKPTSSIEIDSTKIAAAKLTLIENALYGTASAEPYLPLPDDLLTLIS